MNDNLQKARDELRVTEEQLVAVNDDAEEARVRALVSDDPAAAKEAREAAKHAWALTRHRDKLAARLEQLEAEQDKLLDRLVDQLARP